MDIQGVIDALMSKTKTAISNSPIHQLIGPGGSRLPSVGELSRGLMAIKPFDASPQSVDEAMNTGLNLMGSPMLAGKIVYHGSPHKFDKFDASKIGTGEGAQAYGHGVYLADSPGVAESYAGMRPMAGAFTKNGEPWVGNTYAEAMAEARLRAGNGYDATIRKAIKEADSAIASRNHEEAQRAQDIVAALRAMKSAGVEPNTGALYKADLPDEWIPKMLDWDKPLSQQSKEAQQSLAPARKWLSEMPGFTEQASASFSKGTATAKDLYNALVGELSKSGDKINASAASEYLQSVGIPGIRYLDGGSRGAGQGTYNYVVFPGLEDKVKILERNGQKISE